MTNKLYKVTFLTLEDKEELRNIESMTVIATDAEAAIRKCRKRKTYFVQSVELLYLVDKV